MRVVVDTNVFISAALKDTSVPALVLRIVAERATLLKSASTERQLAGVLARPHIAPLVDPASADWMRALIANAELVAITERITACRDPTDDRFLELAISGNADLIVSGDADLLALDPFRGIPIVAPAAFVKHAEQT